MNEADELLIRPANCLNAALRKSGSVISVFERLCVAENYDFEKMSDEAMEMSIRGVWCDHSISVRWDADDEVLQIFVVFDGRIPGGRTGEVCRLIALVNERLKVGHFDFWDKSGSLVYRSTMSLKGGAKLTSQQAMDMIAHALDAAERGYPACQYVVWAGKSPEDALTSALVDLASYS